MSDELRPSLGAAMMLTQVKSIDTTKDYERVYEAWAKLVIGDACVRLRRPPWEHPVAQLLDGTCPRYFSRPALALMLADLLLADMQAQSKWLREEIKRLKGGVRHVVVQGTPVVYRVVATLP